MILVMILLLMALMIAIGKRSKRLGMKQYVAAAIIALLQTAIALVYMFTLEKPPMF